ncbi:MAG TPA: GTP 3',8-cyclase MoaA [Nitrospirae bacterium]|nr:GTP 3',8-cyclase MoaA [Nitrospirota bacterium]
MSLSDRYHRVIDYMRVSVTDRCNLRCLYCMPRDSDPVVYKEILSYEEIARIVSVAANLGVRKIRLTGGEPLARKNIQYLIKRLADMEGIDELSLTTNGLLLMRYAEEIKEAGLNRVNISLDSMLPERYSEITGGGSLDQVLQGIERAHAAGLRPVKINVVVIRGVNDDEVEDFARLTLTTPYHVRFIEFMPGSTNLWTMERCIPVEEIKERIETIAPVTAVKERRHGPARYYRFAGAEGVIGFISAVSHHFCSDCNRLRLTADGTIRPCLFSGTAIDLKSAISLGASDKEIERLLRLSVAVKPEGHKINQGVYGDFIRSMSKIGG